MSTQLDQIYFYQSKKDRADGLFYLIEEKIFVTGLDVDVNY